MIARTLALVLVALAGCGGADGDQPEVPGGADPDDVRVIGAWADALRDGDLDQAIDYFRLPSLVQNGTPPLELDSKEDVRLFNQSLPCGAKLIRAEAAGDYTVATFELTERPGPGECGSGTGNTASTAFLIEDELIVEWRRVPDEPDEGPAADEPVV